MGDTGAFNTKTKFSRSIACPMSGSTAQSLLAFKYTIRATTRDVATRCIWLRCIPKTIRGRFVPSMDGNNDAREAIRLLTVILFRGVFDTGGENVGRVRICIQEIERRGFVKKNAQNAHGVMALPLS